VAGLRRQAAHRPLPAGRVGGQRLPDQASLILEPARDVGHQIVPEGAFGEPEEDAHRQDQDQDGSQYQPPNEAHRLRAPRSPPRNR
jgi:hypothetical protein